MALSTSSFLPLSDAEKATSLRTSMTKLLEAHPDLVLVFTDGAPGGDYSEIILRKRGDTIDHSIRFDRVFLASAMPEQIIRVLEGHIQRLFYPASSKAAPKSIATTGNSWVDNWIKENM